MKICPQYGIIKAVPKLYQKWLVVYIGKSYKGGKDIMVDYKKRQDEGFSELKKILKEKGAETKAIRDSLKRLEEKFSEYIVMNLNWRRTLDDIRKENDPNELFTQLKTLEWVVENITAE